MSQMVTRKGGVGDEKEKEKRQTDSPVKEMKKKMAANAEKEKQAAEKSERNGDKPAEKSDKKDKVDKKEEKKVEKKEADKKDEKKVEKEEADKKVEKKEDSKGEKSSKPEDKKPAAKPSQNGSHTNGSPAITLSDSSDDEAFPELAYDESEPEPEPGLERSRTRREQVKATRTPETPRPASGKRVDNAAEDPKETKVLKLSQDSASERKLRSADSPKPESKNDKDKQESKTQDKEVKKTQEKEAAKKAPETPKKAETPKKDAKKPEAEDAKQNGDKLDQSEMDIPVESETADESSRKPDTNFSKSRVKVSPYRRSTRQADITHCSTAANYTGNNTTMEMDITETSFEEPSLENSYLFGLRAIKGRRSYKPLGEMSLKNVSANRSLRNDSILSDTSRPTAPVVGRKRKPEPASLTLAPEHSSEPHSEPGVFKRMRLLERFSLRGIVPSVASHRNAEIVGINTDLPLSVPVVADDPESLKPAISLTPATPPAAPERDGKRCVVM